MGAQVLGDAGPRLSGLPVAFLQTLGEPLSGHEVELLVGPGREAQAHMPHLFATHLIVRETRVLKKKPVNLKKSFLQRFPCSRNKD